MANEARITWTTGVKLYGVVFRKTDNKVWYVAGAVFETAGTGGRTIADYAAISFAESPAGYCRYVGSFPSAITATGKYDVLARVQAGANPASTDHRAGMIQIEWTGTETVEAGEPGEEGVGGLVTEVQYLTGRVGDTELVTTARCVDWLNKAQVDIADYCIAHVDLEYRHATAITLLLDTYSYSLAGLAPAVLHLLDAFYMDGDNSKELDYITVENFDYDYPSPADITAGIPSEFTKRGNTIELNCPASANEAGKYLRLDYAKVPTAFSTDDLTAVSDMSDADEGLVYFAVSKAFLAIGGDKFPESDRYYQYYLDWREKYRTRKDMRIMSNIGALLAR